MIHNMSRRGDQACKGPKGLADIFQEVAISQSQDASSDSTGWQSDLQTPTDRLAAMYRCSKLTDLTVTFPGHNDRLKNLAENLSGDNLPFIYDTASLLGDETILKACDKVVMSSAESVFSSSDIGQLSRKSLNHLLKQDLHVKSEVSVLNGIVKWGKTHVSHPTESSEDRRSVREEIEEFLPHIRFLTLTLDEFVEHVIPANILTDAECTSILMNMKKVKSVPLPTVCSRIEERRFRFNWDDIHNVSLWTSYNSIYNGNRENYGYTRYQIVTNMKVSKEIYLGRITISGRNMFHDQTWKVEISESSKAVLGGAEEIEGRIHSRMNSINTSQIIATLDPPVLLQSDKVYDIWVTCNQQQRRSSNFSVPYRNLTITGNIMTKNIGIKIHFWCIDDSLEVIHRFEEYEYEAMVSSDEF